MFQKIKNKLNNNRFRHGSMSTVITFCVVAIIILIYAISIVLNSKYSLSLDMTSNKMFEISEESKTFLKNLDSNIVIRVLAPEKDFVSNSYYPEQYNQINRILKMCKKNSKNISLVYDDIIKNPNLANKYDSEVNQYCVVIEAPNGKHRVLAIDNLFEIEQNYMAQSFLKASKAEQAIISSILAITSETQIKIGILSGHQESDISSFKKLLTDNLYEVTEVNLLISPIPEDLSLVVLAAPQKDFTSEEIESLNKFLDNKGNLGKNLIYFASVSEEELPNLDSFLRSWDIKVEKAIAFDETNMTQLGQYSSLVEYSDKELFSSLISKNAYTIFLNSLPVKFINEESDNTVHSSLLSFSDQAVGLKYSSDSIETPEEASIIGPFDAVVKSSKLKNEAASSVIVSGSLFSIDGTLLYQLPISNADAYLTVINSATDKKDPGINIVSKEFKSGEISCKQNTVNTIRIIFVVLIPAVVIGCGLTVWSSRRNK